MDEELGRILVVDDNEMNRDMLSRRLARRGYQVATAEDGHQALALLKQQPIDLVLLDIMMPGISGLEVLKILRKDHSRTELPVIMATAKDASEDVVEALALGANDYVTKPLDMKVTLARVGTHVILKKTAESLDQANQRLSQSNEQLTAANAKLKRDLQSAATVQRSQLPTQSPSCDGYQLAWVYRPCDELGGDFLNVVQLDDAHLGLYLLDVMGHGVSAALMSVAVNRVLLPSTSDTCIVCRPVRDSAGQRAGLHVTPPAEVADRLNRRFPVVIGESLQFFTLVYGILHQPTGTLRLCSAGHPSPILLTPNGRPRSIDVPPSTPVGILQPDEEQYEAYQETVVRLDSGNRLFFYSDGLVEAEDTSSAEFGEERLMQALKDTAGQSLDDSLLEVSERVKDWCMPESPKDDISILALERS